LPAGQQEHLFGRTVDLYVHPKLEINTAFLFGLCQSPTSGYSNYYQGKDLADSTPEEPYNKKAEHSSASVYQDDGLIPSVFFILATTDNSTGGAAYNTSDNSTGSTVTFVYHGSNNSTTSTTYNGAFGSFTPAFFFLGCGSASARCAAAT
jgi:hypothetical protein